MARLEQTIPQLVPELESMIVSGGGGGFGGPAAAEFGGGTTNRGNINI